MTIVTIDGTPVRLGRIRPTRPVTVARFGAYVNAAAVAPPDSVDYAAKAAASLGRMYLNDQLGDCVIAGKAHAIGVWTGNESGTPALVDDQTVSRTYQSWCGPGDNGCNITEVLDKFRDTGFPMDGGTHRIDGYAAVDWSNQLEVQVALYLFGALTLGISLPEAWTNAAVWDVTNSQIVGGHDVTAVGYTAQGVQIASWGKVFTITWPAFTSKKWLEECWAMLAPDWYASNNRPPVKGVDLAALKADLQALANGQVPTIPPVTISWADILP